MGAVAYVTKSKSKKYETRGYFCDYPELIKQTKQKLPHTPTKYSTLNLYANRLVEVQDADVVYSTLPLLPLHN